MATVVAPPQHISDDLWEQLTGRLVIDADEQGIWIDQPTAEVWMIETVRYMDLLLTDPNAAGLKPSKRVDLGWHTFFGHMKDYERYCLAAYGKMLYHQPSRVARDTVEVASDAKATLDYMRKHGRAVNAKLWDRAAGCTNDPTD